MDKLKKWITLTVLGVVVIAAAGWFLLISPQREAAAVTNEQIAVQRTNNQALATELEVLKAKAEELPEKRAALDAVTAKIPTGADLPALVRALTAAAASSGVDLVSVTPGAPALAAPQAPVAAPAPAAAAPAPQPATPPAATAGGAPAVPDAAGVAGTLATIPLSIDVVGDYFGVAQFLSELEDLPRALRITNLTLAPGTSPATPDALPSSAGSPSLTTTITGSVFMATGPAAAAPPVVAAPSAAPAS